MPTTADLQLQMFLRGGQLADQAKAAGDLSDDDLLALIGAVAGLVSAAAELDGAGRQTIPAECLRLMMLGGAVLIGILKDRTDGLLLPAHRSAIDTHRDREMSMWLAVWTMPRSPAGTN